MLGMSFFSGSKFAKAAPASFRPRVDELETRLCPTGSQITLSAQVLPGHLVQLSGTVTGGQVAGVTVIFQGAASGAAQTDANGAYSYTTASASLGSVTAVSLIQPSNPTNTAPMPSSLTTSAPAQIAEPAPVLTMAISYGAQNSMTLTGTLTDIDAGGQTILFSGVKAGSVVTDSNGRFSWTTNATALGAIDATTTDLWSKTSNTAEAVVAVAAPVIVNFGAAHQLSTLWYFSGSVTTANPDGMIIRFGGLYGAVAGRTTTVRADGTFAVSFLLPEGTRGIVTAITTDSFGQDSLEAWAAVA